MEFARPPLSRCAVCGGYRGEHIPSHEPELVVTVFCRCENHNRCARCHERLHEHRLEAAYFYEERKCVWHVPAFCALSHLCPAAIVA